MCGIAGIYNLSGKPKAESEKLVRQMTDSIAHRGPDDEGFFIDDKIALGHRRLSILDLSEAGHQPMFSQDKNLVIVFNGEIYNYKEIAEELKTEGYQFKSGSDTEVILASYDKWGKGCLEKFNGMWAFAIYNIKNSTLFCARDRLGVKPFYYYKDENAFIFASEIKAILEYQDVKKTPNDQIIYDFLAHGFSDHTEETFFKGIKQLLPGHYLEIQNWKLEISQYWDLDPDKKLELTDQQAINNFKELFEDSIKLRLRADVAVGSCLSGGLDSSSIVATANNLLRQDKSSAKSLGERQKTFSSVYEREEFKKANEKQYIDKVIQQTEVEPHFIEPNPLNLWQNLQELAWSQDEPFGSTSIYAQWNVFKLAKENKIKVMLDGQGADEMMAGYLGIFGTYLYELFRQGNWGMMFREIREFRAKHPDISLATIGRNFGFTMSQALPKSIFEWFFKKTRNTKFLDEKFVEKNYHAFKLPGYYKNLLKDYSYWSVKNVSLPSLLHWEDRNSMIHSIESRVPFLDYRLVEYIFALPDNQIIRDGVTKYILREAMRDLLPEEIYNRQDKVGFATPEEIWFKKYVRSQLEEIINSDSFKSRKYFNWPKLKEYFDEVMAGKRKFDFTIWRWISLEMWMRKFID